jgi:phosphoenolpyruvate-protein kinase (PTS system EI component)
MSQPRRYGGHAASPGSAAGLIYQADAAAADPASAPATAITRATPSEVEAAFAAVAAERWALAERLRASGRTDEADIIVVAALIAADKVLVDTAVAATLAGGDAAAVVREAAEAHAAAIAAIPNPEFAERAADVRQVAAAVLDHLAGGRRDRPTGPIILVRRDVAAVDLIELADDELVGAASVAGGASSHAAIVARGLGIPLITGIDPAVLGEQAGSRAILAGDSAELVIGPAEGQWLAARDKFNSSVNATPRGDTKPEGRPSTADGQDVVILCNVASAAETRRGLAAGAAGVGLLRTEIPFTGWHGWPTRPEQVAQLRPILGQLAGRPATVRLLDFSGDKIPPFLRDAEGRRPGAGLAALLGHPVALSDQLAAVLTAGRDADLTILIPMVRSLNEVTTVRERLELATLETGVGRPRLGIMVELAATAAAAETFAPAVDFFSIGTNDLTGDVLGLDRLNREARPGLAAQPRVLALIEHVLGAAAAAGIPVSVCGDAAADPAVLPLLVGLGLRTFSVPAAYVARVRGWIAGLDADACAALAAKSLIASTLEDVRELVRHARRG